MTTEGTVTKTVIRTIMVTIITVVPVIVTGVAAIKVSLLIFGVCAALWWLIHSYLQLCLVALL